MMFITLDDDQASYVRFFEKQDFVQPKLRKHERVIHGFSQLHLRERWREYAIEIKIGVTSYKCNLQGCPYLA